MSNGSHDLLWSWRCWRWCQMMLVSFTISSFAALFLQLKTLTQLRLLCRVLAHYCLVASYGQLLLLLGLLLVGHFFSSLFSISPSSVRVRASSAVITLCEEKEQQQSTVVAVAERRSQSIYRQFTKLRWVVLVFYATMVVHYDRGRWPVTATAIDRRYCHA